jgi:hypothetical protein
MNFGTSYSKVDAARSPVLPRTQASGVALAPASSRATPFPSTAMPAPFSSSTHAGAGAYVSFNAASASVLPTSMIPSTPLDASLLGSAGREQPNSPDSGPAVSPPEQRRVLPTKGFVE